MSDHFFTTFTNYFKCCLCRDGCCFVTKDIGDENILSASGFDRSGSSNSISGGDGSPYSFDDISNPRSPITNSSSNSSIDSFYTRTKYRPNFGIIPKNYYID